MVLLLGEMQINVIFYKVFVKDAQGQAGGI